MAAIEKLTSGNGSAVAAPAAAAAGAADDAGGDDEEEASSSKSTIVSFTLSPPFLDFRLREEFVRTRRRR